MSIKEILNLRSESKIKEYANSNKRNYEEVVRILTELRNSQKGVSFFMFFKLYPEIQEITNKYGYINEIYEVEDDKYIVIENNKQISLMISIDIENKEYTIESSNEYLFYDINTITSDNYNDFLKLIKKELKQLENYNPEQP